MVDMPPDLETRERELRIEKLQGEIDQLKRARDEKGRVKQWLPLVTSLVPVLALLFAVTQFTAAQRAAQQQLVRNAIADSIASERAFMRAVLDRQLSTYFEATSAAATIASSKSATDRARAIDAFWRLYFGPLVMLESPDVSGAMKQVGACLETAAVACTEAELKNRSLALASALQKDYFASWKLGPDRYAERTINYSKSSATTP
ncbi:MAG: hypothetical protein JWL95_1769 [Gemmatimonadetes bacterium]|nr:hypothetical protein [Gemmatimonadota bacterium]